ncbi:GyrI-like domain-containing protein [Escherichia coli]|nr:GyrI-like domain-containing protein [Escherichia coli]EJG6375824.1 effector binding domain-containing protein [Escherichia coli]ELH4750368.1 effector binding domain-containing protein [Escherichia coli]
MQKNKLFYSCTDFSPTGTKGISWRKKIFFKDIIPSNNPLSTLKWNTVDSYLSKDNNPIYISHKLEEDKKDKENMHFNAVFWNNENSYTSSEELTEGIYACFSFTGSRNNYRTFIYNIYMNTLPFYGLQRKDSYDLEIIKKLDSDTYQFEYLLPVFMTRRFIKITHITMMRHHQFRR